MGKWQVVRKLGPLMYRVRVGRQQRYVHIDNLLQPKCVVEVDEEFADLDDRITASPLTESK